VYLVSSYQDTYIPFYSERVELTPQIEASTREEAVVIREMIDLFWKHLKQPSCTRADIVNGKIEYTIQKELGIEIVGDVKVKIAYDEEEDPWEVIMDDDSNEDIQNAEEQIDQEVNEEYLD